MAANEARLTRDNLVQTFPGNSESKAEVASEKPRIEPVAKGRFIRKKNSFLDKLKDSMIGEGTGSVTDYIIYDVLIPAAKAMISDAVSGGIEMLLFGDRRRRKDIRRDGSRSYVSYNSYYNGEQRDNRPNPTAAQMFVPRSRHNFDEVIFSSRGEAEDVLSRLSEMIDEYGMASIADYYDLCSLKSEYTDNKFGWKSLREAFTERVRDGYSIRLPREMPLE